MAAVPSGTTPGVGGMCTDFDTNAAELNSALENAEILTNGVLTLTQIDGSTFTNNIPYFADFVISGLNLNISNVPVNRTLTYTAGTYQINAQVYSIPLGANFQLTAGHPTLPRIDILYLTNTNNIIYQTGVPSVNPVQPAPPAGTLLLAAIGVQINATTSLNYTLVTVNTNSTTIVSPSSTILPGTAVGNTLYWDGLVWTESDEFKRVSGSFSEPYYNYNTTDSTGVFVNVELGESTSSGQRGIEIQVNDTLNTNTADFRLLSQYGSNLATALELIQQDIANDLRSQFLVDPFWMKNEFSLLSDSFNGNFSEDTSDHWYKRIGSDITDTTGNYSDIRQSEGDITNVVNSNSFDFYSEVSQGLAGLRIKSGVISVLTGAQTDITSNGIQIVNLATGTDNIFTLTTGIKKFNIRFNAETQFDVQPNKINLNKRYNVGSKLIGASDYIINSVLTEFVSHYIIVDDTSLNTITLPLASISDNEIIKIVRVGGTNNFNKQIVASGADTFNNTIGLVTYDLANINESVTLQGSALYNTWFVIDTCNKIEEITQRNTAISTTIAPTDQMIISTAALTVTLPATPKNGRQLVLKSTAGTMTINLNGKTIDSPATVTVGNSRTIIFNTTLNTWLNI